MSGLAAAAAVSWGGAAAQPGEHARARLVSERAALVPGTTAVLGVAFDIDPGWHLYWNGRTNTGFPPQAEWTLPAGLEAGAMQWPAPKRYVLPGDILDHIYEKQVTLLLPVRVGEGLKPGQKVTVRASLEWLVCQEACLPGSGEVELTLPVAMPGSAPPRTPEARLIEQARSRLARPLAEQPRVGDVSIELTKGAEWARLEARVEGAEYLAFYPAAECSAPADGIGECEAKGERLSARLEGGEAARAVGVLEARIRGREQALFYEVRCGPGAEAPAPDGE